MAKLCIFISMTITGWVGWWIGAHIGPVTAFMLSSIGSGVGVYLGWRIHRDFIE